MQIWIKATLAAAALGVPMAAQAEVVETRESGFVSRDTTFVAASAKETWLALISPSGWWSSQHTWSADAANLRLTPQAGGCFCEKIPEVVTPDSFTLEGSVEHMRVIQAYPERVLRMTGGLGPLQSEPVSGILTIVLTEMDTAQGPVTRIVWEYNVGGSMRYEIPDISKAVDGVMSIQLAGLADKLGVAEMPEEAQQPSAEPEAVDDADATDEAAGNAAQDDASEEGPGGQSKADEPAADQGPSVDEAFEDLSGPRDEAPSR
jgi:hypothetical protein